MVQYEQQHEVVESTPRKWIQVGGASAAVAGVLYVAMTAIDLLAPQTTPVFTSLTDYAIEGLFAGALLLSLVGLYGLYRAHRGQLGRIGLFGFAVVVLGTAAMCIVATANTAVGREVLDLVFVLGALFWLIGSIVFGIAVMRASVFPSWVGALVLGGPVVSMILEPYGGAIVLGLSWIAIGYVLWSRRDESTVMSVSPAAAE